MTTNIDRATRAIVDANFARRERNRGADTVTVQAAREYAKALAAAGLLMPDLPEPDDKEWMIWHPIKRADVRSYLNRVILFQDGVPCEFPYTPAEARALALDLLAAANHAEVQE